MNVIDLRDIKLTYQLDGRPLQVLSDVNLQVRKGEMVGILGPSGSGKSTLLYILGCLLKPTSGTFLFAGHSVPELDNEKLAELRSRHIGFVFQQFHLLPRADVLENVLLPTRYLDSDLPTDPSPKAKKLLDSVGLSSHIGHKPNQLSGGQQQRVAIARALMNDPMMILADEPTGNLDSKSAAQVLNLLRDIQKAGRTVVIITHDQEVAKFCDRVVTIRDGVMEGGMDGASPTVTMTSTLTTDQRSSFPELTGRTRKFDPLKSLSGHVRSAWQNILRNKTRSFLNMLGVTIGIAAVLSTITLGSYTRTKILSTYESLGVNKLVIRAYPKWNMKAEDVNGAKFEGISQKNDLAPMRRLFPEIRLMSPVVKNYARNVDFGGRTFDQARTIGVNAEYFSITNLKIANGKPLSPFHVSRNSAVCVIGHDVADRLFGKINPVRKIIQVNGDNDQKFTCMVIGVLQQIVSNEEWSNPNNLVIFPETFLSLMSMSFYSKPYEVNLQLNTKIPGATIETLGEKIKQFFHLKYRGTAEVNVDSDQLLVAQMRKFLNLFSALLSGVALISLAVGGIGITNMMLVSVSERFKEIGLRKALGARDQELRMQFLVESVILCLLAGVAGVVSGVIGYHLMLYLASKLFTKIQFEWIFDFPAMLLSVACIFVVGVASGIIPALRAQKLEVVEALRSE